MTTSEKEQVNKIDAKLAQLKAKKQAIINRDKEKERKGRTRRLVQNGALAEKYLNCEGMAPEDFEAVLLELIKGKDPAAPTSSTAAVTNREPVK